MTIWTLLSECVQQLDEPFRRSEIVGWFRRHHPEVLDQSLNAHIQGATAGAPGRGQLASRAPLLERIDRGLYRRAGAAEERAQVVARARATGGCIGAVATQGRVAAVLVGCVKGKRSTPAPAVDLYTSPLFGRRRAYAQASGLPWFVLSAEHGLVRPEALLEPYDRALADQPAAYRDAWGAWVAVRLAEAIGGLAGRTVEIHAGSAYVDALRGPLERQGCTMVLPLRRLRQGEQLAWYDENAGNREADASTQGQAVDGLHAGSPAAMSERQDEDADGGEMTGRDDVPDAPPDHMQQLPEVGVDIRDVRVLEPFSFRWPDADEHFESGWTFRILVDGESHQVRHGLGAREVYGRDRVHTVTWLDNQVQVEGVEADDYPSTSPHQRSAASRQGARPDDRRCACWI